MLLSHRLKNERICMLNSKLYVLLKAALVPLAAWVLVFTQSASATNLSQYFNFDGQLLNDTTGGPLTGSVQLTFRILDPTGSCLLYEETQSSVVLDSTGSFSVKVGPGGGGTRNSTADGGLSWKTIFQNLGQVRASDPTSCVGGYTPATGDARKLRVIVNSTTLSPDYTFASVPMATVAETLQGKVPSDFISSTGNVALNNHLKLNSQSELRFSDVATNYVGFRAPSPLASSLIWTLPAADGTSGQILQTNGSGVLSWVTASGGGGSGLTSLNGLVTSTQTLSAGSTGTAPAWSSAGSVHTLNIPMANATGVTAGLISKTDYDSFSSKMSSTGATMTGNLSTSGNVGIGSTSPGSKLHVGAAPAASGNYGLMSLGSGAFDGTTSGFFNGDSSGTMIAVNAATGYTGNLMDLQVAGSSKFRVTETGVVYGTAFVGDGSGLTGVGGISGLSAGRVVLSSSPTNVADSSNLTFNSTTGNLFLNGTSPLIQSGDALQLSAGGTNKNITLSPSGTGVIVLNNKVGIGTSTPAYPFQVIGASSGDWASIGTNSGGSAAVRFGTNSGAGQGSQIQLIKANGSSAFTIHSSSGALQFNGLIGDGAGDIVLDTNSLSRHVGINTIAPSAGLEVSADGGPADLFMLSSDDAYPGDKFVVKNSGNVGIGTTTPSALLEVAGQIKVTGGAPAAGKVLTSDATGLASWQTPGGGLTGSTTGTQTNIGQGANGSGSGLVGVGYQAGAGYTGTYTTIVGHTSVSSGGSGSNNTIVGGNAIASALNGSHNTAVGANTVIATSANYGVALGKGAQVSGSGGIAIGPGAIAPANTVVIGTSNGSFTERMRIDAGGNVGIGTTSPVALLDVYGPISLGTGASSEINLGGGQGSPFAFVKTAIVNNDSGGFAVGTASISPGGTAQGTYAPGSFGSVGGGDTIMCSPYSGSGSMTGKLTWSCFSTGGGSVVINLICGSGASCPLPTDWRVTVIKW